MSEEATRREAIAILNRHCEYMDGLTRGQRFIGMNNAIAAVTEALRTPASPTDTEGKTFAGFANWFESMPADHPVTVTVADIRRWAQEAGRQWTSALSAAASPGSDVVDTVAAVLERWDNTPPPNDFTGHAYTDIAADVVAALTSLKASGPRLTRLHFEPSDPFLGVRRIHKASALPSGDGWRDIASAPKDGTLVKLRVIYEFSAKWQGGLMDENERDCGGWHAINGDIPPCWTDDICWESNEDESPSVQPSDWRPLDPPGTLKASSLSASPAVGEEAVERAARALARYYGRDPDKILRSDEMECADQDFTPVWREYEAQVRCALAALQPDGEG